MKIPKMYTNFLRGKKKNQDENSKLEKKKGGERGKCSGK
jgi:hypothetical protein